MSGDYKATVERLLKEAKEMNCLEENKEIITNYAYECLATGIKYGSVASYLKVLVRILEYAKNKPLKELTKSELVDFFMNIKPKTWNFVADHGQVIKMSLKEYAPYTISAMKVNVKVFWKWLYKGDTKAPRDEKGSPLAVSWITGSRRRIKEKYKKEALTREEVETLLKSTTSSRTKAILAVLFESGQRKSEFLGMKISQIDFQDDYCEFVCSGKTGERPVILVKSYPYLKKWLADREKIKNIPKEYQDHVWLTTTRSRVGKKFPHPMNGEALRSAVIYTAKKAGIKKRVWVHGLRHSSATDFFKQGYNETEGRLKYGWSRDSNMPSYYTHYKHDELKDKILIRSGKKQDKKAFDGDSLPIKDCPFCTTPNPGDGEFCYKCGKPLDTLKVKETAKQTQALDGLQAVLSQLNKLEEKGLDVQQLNHFLEEWSKQKTG